MTVNLEELKRLCAEATPGPWYTDSGGGFIQCAFGRGQRKRRTFLKTLRRHYKDDALDAEDDANTAFIVAAVNSLPELIAEVEGLRDRVKFLEEANNNDCSLRYLEPET